MSGCIHVYPFVARNHGGIPFSGDCSFFFSLQSHSVADGSHRCHPTCGHEGFPISPRFTPYDFLSRCKFSTLTTRQPMLEFYLLTFPRFPLRKKEHKSYFGENRTHDFRTSRCAVYLLDHSGDYRPHSGKLSN